MSESLREKIAQAIINVNEYRGPRMEYYCRLGDAALAAIETAGYAVVPLEPTEEMVDAGADTPNSIEAVTEDMAPPYRAQIANFYRAMLAARPKL